MSEDFKGFWIPTRLIRTPTGLFVPAGSLDRQDENRALASQGLLLSPLKPVPTLLDQFVVVADESELGFATSTLEDLQCHLNGLPFVSALVLVARLATQLWPIRSDPEAQLNLVQGFFGDPKLSRSLDAFLRAPRDEPGERRYVIDEQQLHVLQRLVIEEAMDGEDDAWSAECLGHLAMAWLGTTTVVGDGATRLRNETRDLADWVGFLAQNGSYNSDTQPFYAMTRAYRALVELPRTEAARNHPRSCDFDRWLLDSFGLDADELFAVGFATQASTMLTNKPEGELATLAPMQVYLSSTKLAEKWELAENAISAERAYFQNGFARSRTDPLRRAWDITPFLLRPMLRLSDGRLCLTSPRAIHSWLTDGWYYKLLDHAIEKKVRDQFTTFAGWLFETYVREIFQLALPDRAPGQGKVHGEYAYGGEMTSDVAIDYGCELVICEVISTRLPLGVRAEADPKELHKYLTRTLLDKIAQLDRVSRDVLNGRAQLPGVVAGDLVEILPVLITAGDLVESEALWHWLRQNLPDPMFGDERVRGLTMLGIEDVEIIAGMVDAGDELNQLIKAKHKSDHRELNFVRWINDTRTDDPPRHPELEKRWQELVQRMERTLAIEPGS